MVGLLSTKIGIPKCAVNAKEEEHCDRERNIQNI